MLKVAGLAKSRPGFRLELGLDLAEGRIAAVLGPSGCGKSTLLRLIAGLEPSDSGSVLVGGRDVSLLPPERRGVGMVFQDYALFPHLSVRRNIEYGPRMLGTPRAERRRIAEAIADSFEIAALLERSPYSLSGGEQQRVALARALAVRPSVLLLDEPLSSLDASLRRRLRAELGTILKSAGMTALLVTHDADEAIEVADEIFVMREGRIDAHGPAEELYRSPPTAWTAAFLGLGPTLEILALERDGESVVARTAIGGFSCAPPPGGETPSLPASLFFPASAPRLAPSAPDGNMHVGRNRIRGRVASLSFAGTRRRLSLSCPIPDLLGPGRAPLGGRALILDLELPATERPGIGEALDLEIASDQCYVLPGSAI